MLESISDNELVRWITAHVRMFHGHVVSFGQLKFVHKLCFLFRFCNCTYLEHLHVNNTYCNLKEIQVVFLYFDLIFWVILFPPTLWQTGLVALNCPKLWICVCLMPYDGLASNAWSILVLFTRLAPDLLHLNQDKAVSDD